ncbi:hypothetical protein AAMO2058_001128100 [Amorphochlora amoebiformis]|mmetsp:Transcript_21383/g.33751  ORF Transcript_21383/g.33751 Transcript_21383/m.33751 type:complete len:340 (-) Transcript_21383:499-1518(-)
MQLAASYPPQPPTAAEKAKAFPPELKQFLERLALKDKTKEIVDFGFPNTQSLITSLNVEESRLWGWPATELNRFLFGVETLRKRYLNIGGRGKSGTKEEGEGKEGSVEVPSKRKTNSTAGNEKTETTKKPRMLGQLVQGTNGGKAKKTESEDAKLLEIQREETKEQREERERITYALKMLKPKAIVAILQTHIDQGTAGLEKVAAVLPKSVAPAQANPMALCFRCGVRYDPQYPSVCVLNHPKHEAEEISYDEIMGFEFRCRVCNKTFFNETRDYDELANKVGHQCWTGVHEPEDEEVREREGWGDPLLLGESARDYLNTLGFRRITSNQRIGQLPFTG